MDASRNPRRGFTALAATVTTATALTLGAAGTAGAAEVATWTGMGPQLPPSPNLIAAQITALRSGVDAPSPTGANVPCVPRTGENPVILIHGMNANAHASWSRLAPALKEQGKCVYALNFGAWDGDDGTGSSIAGAMPDIGGLAPLEDSLAEVSSQIAMVKARTGADTVDLVGYSEGGTMAVAYAKRSGGADVDTLVTVAGVNHGTTMLGLSRLNDSLKSTPLPVAHIMNAVEGPAAMDLLVGSDFMNELNAGGVEVPGVRYTAISTRFDEAATPLENSQFHGGDHRNVVVQDGCATDPADHLGLPYDPRAIAFTLRALGRDVPVACSVPSDFT